MTFLWLIIGSVITSLIWFYVIFRPVLNQNHEYRDCNDEIRDRFHCRDRDYEGLRLILFNFFDAMKKASEGMRPLVYFANEEERQAYDAFNKAVLELQQKVIMDYGYRTTPLDGPESHHHKKMPWPTSTAEYSQEAPLVVEKHVTPMEETDG